LKLRFGLGKGEADKETGPAYTLAEIGDELNMSRERVRQIEAEALAKLRLTPELRTLQSFLVLVRRTQSVQKNGPPSHEGGLLFRTSGLLPDPTGSWVMP